MSVARFRDLISPMKEKFVLAGSKTALRFLLPTSDALIISKTLSGPINYSFSCHLLADILKGVVNIYFFRNKWMIWFPTYIVTIYSLALLWQVNPYLFLEYIRLLSQIQTQASLQPKLSQNYFFHWVTLFSPEKEGNHIYPKARIQSKAEKMQTS